MNATGNIKAHRSAFDSPTFDADVTIHVDKDIGDVGSATISPSGRDVAIASKTGLEIIDLDAPLNTPRHLRYGQSYIVADVQWSPFAARDTWIASASNQKALIWNLTMSEDSKHGAIEHTLDAHSRAITDINFSAHHPDIISTCAVDGYVHCWDLRRPRRPVMTFVDWDAAATQVKWNRQDSHILASSHDQWLRIWDDRWGGSPFKSIEAHDSKIYGLDWNRTRHNAIATCSLDKSIKFWDYTKHENEVLERVIRTDFPVWRARHTPFGWGILAMPQDEPGQLYLFDRRLHDASADQAVPPVFTFPGHGQDHMVKEFLWRSRGDVSAEGFDNRDFQLVSWGTDNQLCLNSIDAAVLVTVGYTKGAPVGENIKVTRKGATYKTFRNVDNPEHERDGNNGSRQNHKDLLDTEKTMTLPKPSQPISINHISHGTIPANRNQIGWMSGIKISKSQPSHTKYRTRRQMSLIGNSFENNDWDQPEALQDEIIRVHKQYGKVTFDNINMDKRSLTVSMNGPWGQSGNSTYVKVKVKFPSEYPSLSSPLFSFDKTSQVSEIVYGKITAAVDQIATGFVQKKRGCLEAIVCYLLGEVDLEDSVLWLMDKEPEGLDLLDGDSSSDEEVPVAMVSSTTLKDSDMSKVANVPRPRLCGASFGNNGQLVCFFPPPKESVKPLLDILNKHDSEDEDEHDFNTFSRLSRDHVNMSKDPSKSEEESDVDDSDYYEDSDDSSSSSSSGSSRFRSNIGNGTFWSRMPLAYRRVYSTTKDSQRSSTIGTHTGTAATKSRAFKPKTVVTLHDMRDLLPAKRVLAAEYAIFGDGAEVCNHNAEVATRYGFRERADLWRYAALLLKHEVPLEALEQHRRQEPILVIARTMLRYYSHNDSDSGVDMSYDKKSKLDTISARVNWGLHPIAKSLIDELFDHYEELCDVQMLAMLSCVFSEPYSEDATARAEVQVPQPETPIAMKTPGFLLDYFPTDVAAWSAYNLGPYSTGVTSRASTPSAPTSTAFDYAPHWLDPYYSPSISGDTPPMRSARGSSDRLYQLTTLRESKSLSTSPDDKRSLRRVNTNSGLLVESSFSRSFNVTAPSSPSSRKKPSPVDHFLSAVTWGKDTVLGPHKEHLPSSRQSMITEDWDTDDLKPVVGISMKVHNQDAFDDDGCMSTPLLPTNRRGLMNLYRIAYASIVLSWDLPLQYLEIAKFAGLPNYLSATEAARNTTKNDAASFTSNDSKDKRTSLEPIFLIPKLTLNPTSQGLDVIGYCLIHETRLYPALHTSDSGDLRGGAIGKCEKCNAVQEKLLCVICEDLVPEVFTPCLSCGCVMHHECLLDYQATVEYTGQCAGGCECDCGTEAMNGIVEGWEVMIGSMRRMTPGFEIEHRQEKDGERYEDAFLTPIDEAGDGVEGSGWGMIGFGKREGRKERQNSMSSTVGVRNAVGQWRKRMTGAAGRKASSGLSEI